MESPNPPPRSPMVRALGYLRAYRLDAGGALLALLVVSAANLAAPQMIRLAIDGGYARNDSHTVLLAVGGLIVIAAGRGLFNFLQGYLAERASQGVAFDMREKLFDRIQRLSFSYYDRAQTGQLLTLLTNDVEQIRTFVGAGIVQMLASLAMLLGCAGVLMWMNVKLALVALSTIIPILFLLKRFVTRMGPLFGKVQMSLGKLNTVLQENLRGLRVVRAFSGEERESARYRQNNEELRDLNLQFVDAVSLNFPYVNFFANVGVVAVVGFGGFQVLGGTLTLGELIAFNSYMAFLLLPIMTMGFLAAQLSRAAASARRVFELIDTSAEVVDSPGAIPLPAVTGLVEFKDVRFRYAGSEREILSGVSFTAKPGQLVAILGATGSGKSTIVNLVPRFYDCTGGGVTIDGHDVKSVTLSSLRSQVGVVLQEAFLFSGRIRDNIAYGRPDATMEDVRAAAKAAHAAEFIEELPQQYETIVGERGVGLSGGQRQRIAIARALLTDPRVLILDDSTSAVDAETEAAINTALDRLMRAGNHTSLVIAQRVSTVRDADLIVLLDEGKIVAQGTHEELLATSPLYHEILGSQLRTGIVAEAA